MNAYELADFIDKYCEDNTSKEAANMLRQQAERIAELENDLEGCEYFLNKTKPLSDEEIKNLSPEKDVFPDWLLSFARAIEERHGIK